MSVMQQFTLTGQPHDNYIAVRDMRYRGLDGEYFCNTFLYGWTLRFWQFSIVTKAYVTARTSV